MRRPLCKKPVSIWVNCIEDINSFLFICYVSSVLCYFGLADQFIKFPHVSFLLNQRISYKNFHESFLQDRTLQAIQFLKFYPSNAWYYYWACHVKHDWYVCIRSCNQHAVKIFYFVWSWFYFLVVGLSVECLGGEVKMNSMGQWFAREVGWDIGGYYIFNP